jgi:hypothetical protein
VLQWLCLKIIARKQCKLENWWRVASISLCNNMSEQAWILQQKEGMFHSCQLRWFSQITMKMILTFGNLSSPFTNFEFS